MKKTAVTGSAPRFYTEDVEKMLAFYIRSLGFRLIGSIPDTYGMVERNGFQLHFAKFNHRFPNRSQAQHLLLWVPEIDLFFEEITQHDVKIIEGITLRNYGNREFIMEDPEGNIITICD